MKKVMKLLAALMMLSPTVLTTGVTVLAESSTIQVSASSEKVVNLNDQIAEIKLETLTVADQSKVDQLIQSYNKLSDEEKAQVKNSSVLQQGAKKIQALLTENATTQASSEKGAEEKTITLSVERFTLGEGYIVEPVQLQVNTEINYATLLDEAFKSAGMTYQHTGTLDKQFYLSGIDHGDNGQPAIPAAVKKIASENNLSLKNNSDDNLAEFDYSQTAGWMYSVNNVFPGVGMSDKIPADGDVFRIQYTVAGLGADLGNSTGGSALEVADKTALTKKIAEINQDKNAWQAQGSNYQAAYQNAMEELANLTASQSEIDQALNAVNNPSAVSDAVTKVSEQISKLPNKEQLELTDKESVLAAKSAFEALSVAEQQKVSAELQNKLQEVVSLIEELTQVASFEEQLASLPDPDKLGFISMGKVPPLRQAYDALSPEAKKKVSPESLAKLEALEARVIQLNKNQANNFTSSIETLRKIAKVINSSNLKMVQLYAENGRFQYEQLTADQRKYINQEDLDYLVEVEAKIKELIGQPDPLLPVKKVEDQIKSLPAVDQLKLSDEKAVYDTINAFYALTDEQQEQVSEEFISKLFDAEERIYELKTQAAVKAVIDQINALPKYDQLTEKNVAEIKAALAAFDALDQDQKGFVTNKAILDKAKEKMNEFSLDKIYEAAWNSGAERIISQNEGQALTEWDALALVHSGYSISEAQQQRSYDELVRKIFDKKDQYGKETPWTDAERQAIGILSLGGDLTDIKGYNIVADLSDSHINGTINNQIYGLIVLSAKKASEKNQQKQIDQLIDQLLTQQLSDGGWALFGSAGDIDITGMTLTALAPYRNQEKVKKAIDKAVAFFKKVENQDGNFFIQTFYAKEPNSNSQAQAILGLSSVGEDLTSETYKMKKGNPIDALIKFQLANGGFKWLINDGNENGMATQQAVQALTQIMMQKNNQGWLYDFEKNPGKPLIDSAVVAVEKQIKDLPAIDKLALEDQAVVAKSQQAFEKLTKKQQAKVAEPLQTKLKEATAKISELAKADLAIKAVEKQIAALPAPNQLTLKDQALVSAAEQSFNQLSATLQKQVDKDLQTKLKQAVKKIQELSSPKPNPAVEPLIKETQNYLLGVLNPEKTVIDYGSEWSILGLARNGYDGYAGKQPLYQSYYGNLTKAVEATKGNLDSRKYTEYSRVILAITAIGKDAQRVEAGNQTYNLFAPLSDFKQTTFQGINGVDFALLAVDSNSNYQFPKNQPAGNQTTRERLIEFILAKELKNGGWNLFGAQPDVDLTAMTLQALAPYYETQPKVKAAVDRGLILLSNVQNKDGGFSSAASGSNGATSESSAQVLTALSALGIDGAKDSRFIKDRSLFQAFAEYHVAGSGFMHILPGGDSNGGATPGMVDGMATEQGMYALVAYKRFLKNENRLYDMNDVSSESDTLISNQVTNQIRALGTITLSKKNQVAAARAAYEGLTKKQKALIAANDLKCLEAAEATIQKLMSEKKPTTDTNNEQQSAKKTEGKKPAAEQSQKMTNQVSNKMLPAISPINGGSISGLTGNTTSQEGDTLSEGSPYISAISPITKAQPSHSNLNDGKVPTTKKLDKASENKKAWDFAGEAYSPKGEATKTPQVSLAKESNNKHKVAIISEVVASILAITGGIFWYFKKFRVRG